MDSCVSVAACGSVEWLSVQPKICFLQSLKIVAAQINLNCGQKVFDITLHFLYYLQIQI